MATWMSHFRIADYFLSRIDNLSEVEFVVGNIGPDCGEPNADWSAFTPSSHITHWKKNECEYGIDLEGFYTTYLAKSNMDNSFYLGYYIHLLSDIEWNEQIFKSKKKLYESEFEENNRFIWVMKKDWYDLDHLFLKVHPDFSVFKVFSSVDEFPNKYLDYYSDTAIIRQVKYISNFYNNFNGNLDREYPYLTKEEMDAYIEKTCAVIHRKLIDKGLISF